MTGTFTKRGDKYRLQVYINGERFTKTVDCKTDAQAKKVLAKFYTDCEAGNVSKPSKATMESFSKLYLDHMKKHVKISTWQGYKTEIDNFINIKFGKKKLNQITTLQIQKWIDSIESSPKTIRNKFSLLSNIFKKAVIWGYVSKNPCDNIILPTKRKKETESYTKEEVNKLINALNSYNNIRNKTAVMLVLFGGLRNGELHALKWKEHIDGNVIHIRKNRMCRAKLGVYEDTPKTQGSIRDITIPDNVVNLLSELKKSQNQNKKITGSKYIDSGYVLQNEFGEPLHPSAIPKWLLNFEKEIGLRKLSIHKLRHTHTSMLAYLDMDKVKISKRLGHSQLSTTLNIYTHLFEETDTEIAKKLTETYFTPESHHKEK